MISSERASQEVAVDFERKVSTSRRPARALLTSSNGLMRHVLDQLDLVSQANATVLIQGESGTGKEVIARAIHERGPRRRQPFVKINCAALPEGVLESELFGHEKGAFTGAVRQRQGRFELAHEGTILLDEIGAADGKVQQRLLRVIQEREIERVGGTHTLRVDVRVVAATNVDLPAQIKKGSFRDDLYYRLNVIPLELPPLRERRQDIPLLIEHFLGPVRRGHRRGIDITAEAVRQLAAYPWPGNIRQLENVLERMVVLSREEGLSAADIPPEVRLWREDEDLKELAATSYWEARDQFEKRFLCQALRRHSGVLTQVAAAIGVSRKHLYIRMGQLCIDYRRYR